MGGHRWWGAQPCDPNVECIGNEQGHIIAKRCFFQPWFSQSSPFVSCTFDRLLPFLQEEFIKRCRRKVESIKESQLEVDGEFMSEQDMLDENYKPCLGLHMYNELYIIIHSI